MPSTKEPGESWPLSINHVLKAGSGQRMENVDVDLGSIAAGLSDATSAFGCGPIVDRCRYAGDGYRMIHLAGNPGDAFRRPGNLKSVQQSTAPKRPQRGDFGYGSAVTSGCR